MTEWTTHTPAFDGDAPEGVRLDTHEVAIQMSKGDFVIVPHTNWAANGVELYYRPRATYAQVKAYCEQHGHPVPPKPVDYEAWRPVLDNYGWETATPMNRLDHTQVRCLIEAFRLAQSIPACMDDIRE